MPPPVKDKQPPPLTVGEFYKRHGEFLQLSLQGRELGFTIPIGEPSINRPGLALAGFLDYFALFRIQVIGNSEHHYLEQLPEPVRLERFRLFCRQRPPCIVVARDRQLPDHLLAVANTEGIPVFTTGMISMKFINAATIRLEWDYAKYVTLHGCMVDILGMGVMLMGPSGIGKSETMLNLLDRGGQFVADDSVVLKCPDGKRLFGTQKPEGRFHMEIRGVGIINVFALFGSRCILAEKQLELIIDLLPPDKLNELDRLGDEILEREVLGVKIPLKQLAVTAGRDTARMVEVAALNQRLRSTGYETAVEFNKTLLEKTRMNDSHNTDYHI